MPKPAAASWPQPRPCHFKQYRNPVTKHWAKHNVRTGRIVDMGVDGKRLKDVPKGGQG